MRTLPLEIEDITDQSTMVAGLTDPSASIKVDYDQTNLTTTADTDGNFAVDLEQTLSVGTQVSVSANKQFLTKNLVLTSEGSVSIVSIDQLNFKTFISPSNYSVIYRQNTDFSIEVARHTLIGWRVVSIRSHFKPANKWGQQIGKLAVVYRKF